MLKNTKWISATLSKLSNSSQITLHSSGNQKLTSSRTRVHSRAIHQRQSTEHAVANRQPSGRQLPTSLNV